MDKQEVIALMVSSRSEQEWNNNCDEVKRRCGGYPSFWFAEIIASGLLKRVAATWGGSGDFQITSINPRNTP